MKDAPGRCRDGEIFVAASASTAVDFELMGDG